MVWIKNTNTSTNRHYNADLMDEPVEYSENGTAQVSEEVAERLIEHYEQIEYKKETE